MNKFAALTAILLATACAGDGMMEEDITPENPENPENPETPDTTAPTFLSISPADGDTGIRRDAPVVIRFSEAMDQLSVQNSIDSTDLGAVDFGWSDGGATLTITPATPLEYAEGTGIDPSVTPGIAYQVVVGTGATDEAGNAVAEGLQSKFTTLKSITYSLSRDNEQTGAGTPSGVITDEDDFLVVGDDDAGGAANGYRGYITMDLSPIPQSAVEIFSAGLRGEQLAELGDPYGELSDGAGLLIDHGIFALGADGNENAAFNMAPLSSLGDWADTGDVDLLLNVTAQVQDDFANRVDRLDRSQYRLSFTEFTNLDDTADAVYISRDKLELDVIYLAP